MDMLRVQVQKTLPAVAELVRPWLAGAPEPLRDTLPPQSLGDPDSRWVRVNNIDLHYKQVCPSSFMKFFLSPKRNKPTVSVPKNCLFISLLSETLYYWLLQRPLMR